MTDFATTITCGWIHTDDAGEEHRCTRIPHHYGDHEYEEPQWCADHGYYATHCFGCVHDEEMVDARLEGLL